MSPFSFLSGSKDIGLSCYTFRHSQGFSEIQMLRLVFIQQSRAPEVALSKNKSFKENIFGSKKSLEKMSLFSVQQRKIYFFTHVYATCNIITNLVPPM